MLDWPRSSRIVPVDPIIADAGPLADMGLIGRAREAVALTRRWRERTREVDGGCLGYTYTGVDVGGRKETRAEMAPAIRRLFGAIG